MTTTNAVQILPSSILGLLDAEFSDRIGGEIESSSRISIYLKKAEKIVKLLTRKQLNQGHRHHILRHQADDSCDSIVRCHCCNELEKMLLKASVSFKELYFVCRREQNKNVAKRLSSCLIQYSSQKLHSDNCSWVESDVQEAELTPFGWVWILQLTRIAATKKCQQSNESIDSNLLKELLSLNDDASQEILQSLIMSIVYNDTVSKNLKPLLLECIQKLGMTVETSIPVIVAASKTKKEFKGMLSIIGTWLKNSSRDEQISFLSKLAGKTSEGGGGHTLVRSLLTLSEQVPHALLAISEFLIKKFSVEKSVYSKKVVFELFQLCWPFTNEIPKVMFDYLLITGLKQEGDIATRKQAVQALNAISPILSPIQLEKSMALVIQTVTSTSAKSVSLACLNFLAAAVKSNYLRVADEEFVKKHWCSILCPFLISQIQYQDQRSNAGWIEHVIIILTCPVGWEKGGRLTPFLVDICSNLDYSNETIDAIILRVFNTVITSSNQVLFSRILSFSLESAKQHSQTSRHVKMFNLLCKSSETLPLCNKVLEYTKKQLAEEKLASDIRVSLLVTLNSLLHSLPNARKDCFKTVFKVFRLNPDSDGIGNEQILKHSIRCLYIILQDVDDSDTVAASYKRILGIELQGRMIDWFLSQGKSFSSKNFCFQSEAIQLCYLMKTPQKMVLRILAEVQESAFDNTLATCIFISMLGNVAEVNSAYVEKESKRQVKSSTSVTEEGDYMDSFRQTEEVNRKLRLERSKLVEDGFLASYVPVIRTIILNRKSFPVILINCALWTLTKFMMISPSVASGVIEFTGTLLEMMEPSEISSTRSLCINLWADLACILQSSDEKELAINTLYQIVKNEADDTIRYTCFLRLSNLVLQRQLRKDRLHVFCSCLSSECTKVQQASALFFRQYFTLNKNDISLTLFEIFFSLDDKQHCKRPEITTKLLETVPISLQPQLEKLEILLIKELFCSNKRFQSAEFLSLIKPTSEALATLLKALESDDIESIPKSFLQNLITYLKAGLHCAREATLANEIKIKIKHLNSTCNTADDQIGGEDDAADVAMQVDTAHLSTILQHRFENNHVLMPEAVPL